jgi:hypothetical protein
MISCFFLRKFLKDVETLEKVNDSNYKKSKVTDKEFRFFINFTFLIQIFPRFS